MDGGHYIFNVGMVSSILPRDATMGVEQLVVHPVWDRDCAGSSPASHTKNEKQKRTGRPATDIGGSPNR